MSEEKSQDAAHELGKFLENISKLELSYVTAINIEFKEYESKRKLKYLSRVIDELRDLKIIRDVQSSYRGN